MGNCGNSQRYSSNDKSKPFNHDSQQHLEDARMIHNGSVLGLEYADGHLYTGSDDKTIGNLAIQEFCQDVNYSPLHFTGHTKAVNRLLFSTENVLWSASRDLSIRMWDVKSGTSLRTIENAHSLNVSALTAPQGADFDKLVFSGSRDYSVKGWDVETGQNVMQFQSPRNIVTTMSSRAVDNHLVYQGSEDLCIRVWDIRSRDSQPAIHMTGYVYFPLCMSLQTSGNLLVTGTKGFNSVGCGVMIWDLRNTAKPMHEFKGHTQDVTGCAFLPQHQDMILSVSKDGSVLLWDVNKREEPNKSFQFPKKWISCLKVFPDQPIPGNNDGNSESKVQFAVGALDGSVNLMSLDVTKANNPFTVHVSTKPTADSDSTDNS